MNSKEISVLHPESLMQSTRQQAESVNFLRNLISERNEIEQKYARKLHHWAEKNRSILQNSATDSVYLESPIDDVVDLFLTEADAAADCHQKAFNSVSAGPLNAITSLHRHSNDAQQILLEYQRAYDNQHKLMEKAQRSAEKYRKVYLKNKELVKELEETLETFRGPAGMMSGAKKMLKKTKSKLTDIDATISLARTKCESHCKREQSHRQRFAEEIKRYEEMILLLRREKTEDILKELETLLDNVSRLYHTSSSEAKYSPMKRLDSAIELIAGTEAQNIVDRWQRKTSETILFPSYRYEILVETDFSLREEEEAAAAQNETQSGEKESSTPVNDSESEDPIEHLHESEEMVAPAADAEAVPRLSDYILTPEQQQEIRRTSQNTPKSKSSRTSVGWLTYVTEFRESSSSDEGGSSDNKPSWRETQRAVPTAWEQSNKFSNR